MIARSLRSSLIVVVLVLGVASLLVAPSGTVHPAAAAPLHVPTGSTHALASGASTQPAAAKPHSVPATASTPSAHSAARGAVTCNTPSGIPIWNSPNFFSDALVTFYTPGSPSLSGSNFQIMPCGNTLPTYTNGFWMNVSTNVPITQGTVQIWGVNWPGDAASSPITGYSPLNVTIVPMQLNAPFHHTASFFFNDYRFFWPGSTVYFNITLVSVNATPSTIYSARGIYSHAIQYNGVTNNATFTYGVQAPFASANFSQDISIRTIPSVLTDPSYEPNRYQTMQVIIDAINASGGPPVPIPQAQLNVTLVGQQIVSFPLAFSPENHSHMVSQAFGPYPGYQVQFYVTAWLPWQLTQVKIDRITSPVYKFNWTTNGGWWYPSGQFSDNLDYTTSPPVLGSATTTVLSTGTAVNVTVHVKTVENVTIGSGEVHFRFADASGMVTGALPMHSASLNTSYAVIPGLPNGGTVTFYSVVKDSFGNPISSANSTYTENGSLTAPLPFGYGIFFFEAVDLSAGGLVANLPFTIANGSWSESGIATPLGFGFPIPINAPGYLPVAYGTYVLTIQAFGTTQTATFTVESGTPSTIVFYVSSGPVTPFSSVPVLTIGIVAAAGIAGAAVATYPILNWFKDRRKKSEEEQRRITL